MKVGIVGSGLVGATSAYALVMRGVAREIVLVDRTHSRAAAEADDILHAVPFAHPAEIRAGDYDDLAGCHLVLVCAGVSQRPGETRMDLLARNAEIMAQILPRVISGSPDAVILVATNPVDVMTHVADAIARSNGMPVGRVFGTGTTLDTARFRTLIAARVGVDARHIHAYVLGEHGDTEVLAWSAATVAGMPLDEFCATRGVDLSPAVRRGIDDAVHNAAYRIIEGKGATHYGIGSAIAQIIDTVLGDHRSVLAVCAPTAECAGVTNVTLALPRLVGGTGILDTFELTLSAEEADALHHSATVVRDAYEKVAGVR